MRNDGSPLAGRLRAGLCLLLLCGVAVSPPARGAPDGAAGYAPVAASGDEQRSIFGLGETLELTISYPAFQPGETVRLHLFLADLATNKPIPNAELSLTLTGPGMELALEPTAADSPGIYQADVTLQSRETFSFMVEVTAGETFDLFSVDGFEVWEPNEAVGGPPEIAESGWGTRLPLGFLVAGMALSLLLGYFLGARRRVKVLGKENENKGEEPQ